MELQTMENQEMEIQSKESNLFEDMPQAPTPPKLPKYFPDLQGENRGRTPHAGWYQNDLLPWIQNQDLKKLVCCGIGMILLAGKLLYRILTVFDLPKFLILLSVTAVLLGLGIHKYILYIPYSEDFKDLFICISLDNTHCKS